MNDILNPYIAGAPVVETSMFFGRDNVFDWIERSLVGKYVDHILVLHGQRRVGKTSVLKQIPNFLPENYIQVFFDLQGRTNTTLDRFLWWLAREITRTLKQELNIDIPRPNRVDFSTNPDYLINEFLPKISTLLDGHILLLTFDEFDTLTDPSIQDSLSKPLIAYLRRLMENKTLNFIFSIGSSGNKLEHMQAAYTDFFKTALYRKISFLTKSDCARLITQPVANVLTYDPQAVEHIFEVTSGHPYFVQLVCHELFSMCQKTGMRTIYVEDVENILSSVIERGTVNLKFVWDEASVLQKWVLTGLAQLRKTPTTEELSQLLRQQQVRFTEADLNAALIYLRDKDVITEKNEFVIHLMWMWMQKNRPFDRVREELTEINPIVSRNLELGQEYQANSRFNEAIECFNTALGEDPHNLDAQLGLGECYLSAGHIEQAVNVFANLLENFGESIRVQAGYCNAFFALGDIETALEHWEAAQAAFLKVLEINPLHRNATQELVRIFRIQIIQAILARDIQQAQDLLARARKVAHDPNDLDAYSAAIQEMSVPNDVRFEILEELSEQEHARKHWDEGYLIDSYLTENHPETPTDSERVQSSREKALETQINKLKHWARTFTKAGKPEKALDFWRRLLDFDLPDSDRIRQTIRQLEAEQGDKPAHQTREKVWKRTWVLVMASAAALVILGIFFGPRVWNTIAPANDVTPTATMSGVSISTEPTDDVTPTDTMSGVGVSTEPADVPESKATDPATDSESGTDELDTAVKIALDTIQSEEPTYQTSFDTWDYGSPSRNAVIENGKAIVSSEKNDDGSSVEFTNNSGIFAVEYDFRMSESTESEGSHCVFDPHNNGTGEFIRSLNIGFNSSGAIFFAHYVHPEQFPETVVTESKYDFTEPNTVTVIVLEDQVAVLLDDQVAFTAPNPNGYTIYNWLTLSAYSGATCEYDNFQFWDLSEVDFSGDTSELDPAVQIALDATQNEEPLYHTDFDSWDFSGVHTNVKLENGKLVLNSENHPWVGMHRFHFSSSQFAVEFKFEISETQGEPGACAWNVMDENHALAIDAFSNGDLRVHHPYDIQDVMIGVTMFDPSSASTIKAIVIDDQVSIFIDGELAFTATDPEGSAMYTGMALEALPDTSQITCAFDSFDFWDLSDVDFSESTSSLDPTIQIALDTIQSQEPAYQTSFDAWEFGDPVENVSVENGELLFTPVNYQWPVVQISSIPSDYFVVEFDLRMTIEGDSRYCTVEIYNGEDSETLKRGISAGFSLNGDINIQHRVPPDNYVTFSPQRIYPYDKSESNTVRLVILGDQITAFLDDELIFTAQNPDGIIAFENQYFSASPNSGCEFDNYKFWDLTGADFNE